MTEKFRFGTRAIHAGQDPDPSTGAIMTPIYQTSTYVQKTPGKFIKGYDYARSANPTRTALEANIASLENGRHGICFGSGCAALDCVLHLLNSGEHALLGDDVYGGTFRLFDKVFKRQGIEFSQVDFTKIDEVRAAIRPNTKVVWLETPTNPMLKVVDIAAVASLTKAKGILLVVDNTFSTPFLQTPLTLGADVVSHSLTKYMGGHSDVIGGALVVNDPALAERLHFIQNAVGAVPSPHDCFLVLRSTKTLHVRMERHCQNAEKIAAYLEANPKVAKVIYPGLPSHPQYEVARKQMCRFGGMITMIIKGGLAESRKFLETVHLFSLAESLGGVESLIEHPGIMTHASVPADQRAALGIVDGLIRLSVGIEDVDDLIDDLKAAFAVI